MIRLVSAITSQHSTLQATHKYWPRSELAFSYLSKQNIVTQWPVTLSKALWVQHAQFCILVWSAVAPVCALSPPAAQHADALYVDEMVRSKVSQVRHTYCVASGCLPAYFPVEQNS